MLITLGMVGMLLMAASGKQEAIRVLVTAKEGSLRVCCWTQEATTIGRHDEDVSSAICCG
jgi:hypothetical protein